MNRPPPIRIGTDDLGIPELEVRRDFLDEGVTIKAVMTGHVVWVTDERIDDVVAAFLQLKKTTEKT